MNLAGLELNATGVRAVGGPLGDFPTALPLEPPEAGLPLCVFLDGRTPVVGQAGLALCRRQPHRVLRAFLPALGEEAEPGRAWLADATLDGVRALDLVLCHLQPACRAARGVVLALPDYLRPDQVELVRSLAGQAGLPVLGSLSSALAAALAAHAEQTWFGTALVLDLDEHALSLAVVHDAGGQAHLLGHRALPHLGLAVWKARLLNALADCCIIQSRRDPRDSSAAEQSLFDQLDGILHTSRHGRLVNVVFQTDHWYQNFVLQPEDPSAFCAPLVRQVQAEVSGVLQARWPKGPPQTLLLTAAAGLLPGLVPALQDLMRSWERWTEEQAGPDAEEDFSVGLTTDEGGPVESVVVLSPEAAARGAHAAAAHFQPGDLAGLHLDRSAPLPLPQPLEAGPARLQFQGQDYLLQECAFLLGRQPDCDLVLDRGRYPQVSPQHCEVLYDPEAYQLHDHSREGTWVNDQPVTAPVALRAGDWIRLGPGGPLVRFLGQAAGAARNWSVASGL